MIEFGGYTFDHSLVAASCPLTESVYRLKCCRDAGFSAAILKSATDYSRKTVPYGRKVIYTDSGYYADSSFEREILTIDEALALYKESKGSDTGMRIIPSVAIASLREEDWYEMCVKFQEEGAGLIQLDFFYLGLQLCDKHIYQSVYRSLCSLNHRLSATLMPKLNIRLAPQNICQVLAQSGTECVSLLDSIRKTPPSEYHMHNETTSFFGPEQLPKTLEYVRTAVKHGLKVCAGGGVNSADDVDLLSREGAELIQVASFVLKNGYNSVSDLIPEMHQINIGDIRHHTWCDIEEGFACEGCGACVR